MLSLLHSRRAQCGLGRSRTIHFACSSSGFELSQNISNALSEFVGAQSHSMQPLWTCQPDQKKQDSANQPELRVLKEYPGLHREFDIFTQAAGLQMSPHDSVDGRRSLLHPKE